MHILIFDDDERINAFIAAVARGQGCTVESATRDTSFHALFDARRPDAIFLDLQLGVSDGIEQLRFLHRRGFTGAVVLISGFDARVLGVARQVGESLGLSIDAVIEKPARAAQVVAALAEIRRRANGPDITGTSASSPGGDASSWPIVPWDIARAVDAGEMELRLQPIVSVAGGTVTRAEGLLRWHHPSAGMISPDRFLPIAERDDAVIDQLTKWVIETAIVRYRQLMEQGLDVRICVNVSGRNLRSLRFPDMVAALLEKAGAGSDAIGLEITESVATSDINATADILTRLRLKGFTLAIDDFGMGYSSLEALRRMPFSVVKVDKGFVADLLTSGDSLSIVKSVIDLARNMKLATVAEGVETAEVAELLVSLGVGALQGHHFSRALPFAQFVRWLRDWRSGESHHWLARSAAPVPVAT